MNTKFNFPIYDVLDMVKIVIMDDPEYSKYLNLIGIITEIDREGKTYYVEFFDDGEYLNKDDNGKEFNIDSDVFFENELEKIT